ncbi:MAG TPA: tetratricopeptide repeat protein [Herpetosiphonaceae bacterium]
MTSAESPIADRFQEHIKQALEHVTDPAWLGQHSPLARPYFLGAQLWGAPDAASPGGRGRVLQRILQETAAALEQQAAAGPYAERILDLTYFRPQLLFDVLTKLGIGRSTYYRHLTRALEALAGLLVRRINPALRLERPLSSPLVGREDDLAALAGRLAAGQSVALVGSPGVGKTSLGAALAAQWAPAPVFWWTVRPGLHDQLPSLSVALAYFLHSHGASGSWLQLVADHGTVSTALVPGLIRHDLGHLRAAAPLLCVDECDLLRPDEREDHGQLVAFLESLRGLAPMLLLGQRRALDADSEYQLAGFGLGAVRALAEAQAAGLGEAEIERLAATTAGNPRLLRLVLALHRPGAPLAETLPQAAAAPSLELLVRRLWQRLAADEQRLLLALSVFRRVAPADAWEEQRPALDRLLSANLAQADGQGGVAVTPALRPAIFQLLGPAQRETAHLAAAQIRAERGEYTAAAYHWIQGGQAGQAVAQWYAQREQEIDQGQASVALQLFGQLSERQLPEELGELLVVLRSELRMVAGDYAQARAELQSLPWPPDHGATLRVRQFEGDISLRFSQFDRALGEYGAGLSAATLLLERELAHFRVKLGTVHGRKRDLEQAWREAELARYEVEQLQGYLRESSGELSAGYARYQAALAIAEELGYAEGIARTCNTLAMVLSQQLDFAAAAGYWQRAFQYYQTSGNLSRLARIKANQAGLYTELGQTATAIAAAEEALALFTQLGESQGRGHAAHNLADAHRAAGNLAQAAEFALQALAVGQPGVRPYSLLTLAEIRLDQGLLAEAEASCRESLAVAEQQHDRRIGAYARRALGQICLAADRAAEAGAAWTAALELFSQVGLAKEAAQTQALLATLPPEEAAAG